MFFHFKLYKLLYEQISVILRCVFFGVFFSEFKYVLKMWCDVFLHSFDMFLVIYVTHRGRAYNSQLDMQHKFELCSHVCRSSGRTTVKSRYYKYETHRQCFGKEYLSSTVCYLTCYMLYIKQSYILQSWIVLFVFAYKTTNERNTHD